MTAGHCNRTPSHGDTPLAQAGFDPVEQGVLTIARLFFQSFAFPNSHAWLSAFARAGRLLPPGAVQGRSRDVAFAVLGAVQEMRTARKSGFRFSNPDCPCCASILSDHERHFLEVLRALRRGTRSQAHCAAMLVCEGNPADGLLLAMSDLAALTRARPPSTMRGSGVQADRGLSAT
ncbi:hypothetical protein [Rhodovulum adriaticum]|uniref:Uncharacterized protein n=1 Tax=Rhodovulum adriaticum TaxID=35804 RepID=A0A4R2NKB0_RHOAD|nr:hypothetical protein [Rhodovulum adriaticum]MBK1637043.1 hypothetical protein [Rhodovulum adriaticum]TCP21983.1 hypothetical protein EV656_10829 [Rhodovulum adriaticum]